jgi:hypothetical protein
MEAILAARSEAGLISPVDAERATGQQPVRYGFARGLLGGAVGPCEARPVVGRFLAAAAIQPSLAIDAYA